MIDPRQVMVCIPSYSQRIVAEAVGSLIACTRFFAQISITQGVSHVAMARNLIAEKFLRSGLEWLVSIDDDMAFTPNDFQILMEPCAPYYAESPTDQNIARLEQSAAEGEHPTHVTCSQYRTKSASGLNQPAMPVQDIADAIVCAEYSFKDDSLTPCRQGLGFVRIHRSVFETLQNMRHEDGTARLWQSIYKGRMVTDFYPSGPIVSMIVPGAPWTGEDHGFFLVCKLAGIVPRIETRTKLFHVGSKAYPYAGGSSVDGAQ